MQKVTKRKRWRWDVGMSIRSNNEIVERQLVVSTMIINRLEMTRVTWNGMELRPAMILQKYL